MSIATLPRSAAYPQGNGESSAATHTKSEWAGAAIGGTLLVGSLLLLGGKRKAGLAVTAAGATLALLEEQDTVRTLWNALPEYLDEAQRLFDRAQTTLDDLASKRDKLRALFNR